MPVDAHLPATPPPVPPRRRAVTTATTAPARSGLSQMVALAPGERPRERLRAVGVRALGTAELLAVVLGSGIRGRSALGVAHEVLASGDGSLRALGARPVGALGTVDGVGPVRAMVLAAALELGRRAAAEVGGPRPVIRSPRDVVTAFAPHLEALAVEEFHVALLDVQHRLVRDVLVTRGLLDSSLVHPREVFREAIADGAASVVLVHNHPSGDPTPSAEDRVATAQLVAAGTLLGIPVRDHVVVGRGSYVSFAEAGWLSTGR
ncbi:MAG: DNA repair protein RadC [Gemmatimonadaceae bacterium]|nr:DNA repair protein RadC [Gemmatimonadaceae bacterium]